ncbi:MAG TPA: flagellin lysine-N-methylase [Oligoflexia bacterium]|nr:flagellin lysine-N-methylase [Oligoflexia bacterium]HMP48005.1 flagellin lysine-N-methylase [Oligoflexia bacterium]
MKPDTENKPDRRTALTILQSLEFQCTGSECEDICCKKWEIGVDEFTFKEWQDSSMWNSIKLNLKIIPDSQIKPECAAYLKLNPNNQLCNFLDEDKLCIIHKTLGGKALGHTCRTYPREDSSIGNVPERSFTLSCPEAARLILTPKEGLHLEISDNIESIGPFYKNLIDQTFPSYLVTVENYMRLRVTALKIIRHREHRLENRLILLGLFADYLQRIFDNSDNSDPDAIDSLTSQFESLLSKDRFDELKGLVGKIPVVIDTKIDFLSCLLNLLGPHAMAQERFYNYFKSFSLVLNNYEKDDFESTYNKKREIYIKHFQNEYMLENYLFNSVFASAFPVISDKPLEQFLRIALKFCIIRELLITMCDENKLPSSKEIIQLIQSFTRMYEHSKVLQDACIGFMKEINFISLPHACILIRD